MDRERTNLAAGPVGQARTSIPTVPPVAGRAAVAGWLRSVEVRVVMALLLLAFLRGLLYVVMVPPWDHYDEPTHFEYAALISILGHRPTPDETDRALRFAIARSVHIYAPWRISRMPVDTGTNPLPDIGVSQVSHPSLYYMLASLPLRLTAHAPIEIQLYSMRVFSLLLYLLGMGIVAFLARLAFPASPELRVAALSVILCVPPFTRLMTAASNDALVALVGVFLLLIGVVILQQGWSWISLLLVLLGFLLPFVTKRTIFVMSLVPVLAWVLVAPRIVRRSIVAGAVGVLVVGLTFLLSMPRGSSYWVTAATQRMPQPSVLAAHIGQRSLALSSANPQDANGVGQMLSPLGVFTLPREELTVGVWARSLSGEVEINPPAVLGARGDTVSPVKLGPEWQFIKHKVRMPRYVYQVEMRLNPPLGAGTVLYDDAVAVFGDYSKVDTPPTIRADGQIEWRNDVRSNMISNGSAELVMPILHLPAAIEERLQNTLPFGTIDLLLSTFGDPHFIAATYPSGARFLFTTFWLIVDSGVSGSNIQWWTIIMTLLAVGAIAGWLVLVVQRFRQSRRLPADQTTRTSHRILALCWAGAGLTWGIAMMRVHIQPPWPAPDYTYPIGRYAYAAFVPTVILLVAGLAALLPRRWWLWLSAGLIVLFFTYDVQTFATKIWFHYVAQ